MQVQRLGKETPEGQMKGFHKKHFYTGPKKNCVQCSITFKPNTSNQLVCSHECYRARAKFLSDCSGDSRSKAMKSAYGIDSTEYNQMEAAQQGLCAICKRLQAPTDAGKPRLLFIDHDHRTGKVRGLLCTRCNAGLGMFLDDASLMKRAILYLESSCK